MKHRVDGYEGYLADDVHQCALESHSEREFFQRLRREGIAVRPVWSDEAKQVVDYAVRPLNSSTWTRSRHLGPEVSLVALREGWRREAMPRKKQKPPPRPAKTKPPKESHQIPMGCSAALFALLILAILFIALVFAARSIMLSGHSGALHPLITPLTTTPRGFLS